MADFGDFVERLALVNFLPSVCNPYAGASGETQRANLQLYLHRMAARQPRILLVGEAPGYRGCRVTGVPFTSEAILLAEPAPFDLFGAAAGFRPAKAEAWRQHEATATILWRTLQEIDVLPLLWNAFPFHPHRPGIVDSNRPPSRAELAAGRESLAFLMERYPIVQVIAVGNKAFDTLSEYGINAVKVRHPAHGGKAAFARELAVAVNRKSG